MSGLLTRLRTRFKRFKRSDASGHLDGEFSDEWEAVTERARSDMEARHRALEPLAGVVANISAALLRADPVGLGDAGSADEYDSEAETVVLRLSDRAILSTEDEVLQIVHDEFVRWFGEDLAGPRERYSAAAAEVHRIWGEYLAE